MKRILLGLTLLALPAAAESETAPLQTAAEVDLDRYSGRWYEIARLPNKFQNECARNVVVHYSLKPDGNLQVHNTCATEEGDVKSAIGEARIAGASKARLEVRFAPKWLGWLPQVWGDYWILELDDEYHWAVIGEPDRKYFWILSRTPVLDPDLLAERIERAKAQGYALDGLILTEHSGPVAQAR